MGDRVGKQLIVLTLVICCSFLRVQSAGFTTTKITPRPLWNETFTDKLRKDLLLNYDKFARPAQHYNTTTVKIGLVIRHIEVNEFKSTLTVYSWARLIWNDDKLKWNASDYGGIKIVNIADHEIWQPDIFLYNSAVSSIISHYNTHCIVYSHGEVLWVPPTQYTVLCNFNLKYWPFDTQHCQLDFGSWTHHGSQINIVTYAEPTPVELDLYVNGTEWAVISTRHVREVKYYNCCEEPYPLIRISIDLQRVSPSYKALIVTPTFVIIILTLLSFWLPPQSGEKILLNGVTALIITLFMLYFTQKIPAMGSHTPLIVMFYSSSLYVICFSFINSVVVIWMSRTQHMQPVPWIIKDPLMGSLGKWLGLSNYIKEATIDMQRVTAEEMRDHQVTDFEEHSSDDKHFIQSKRAVPHQCDWVLLAAAIDRISFVFYSVLFMILAISYAV